MGKLNQILLSVGLIFFLLFFISLSILGQGMPFVWILLIIAMLCTGTAVFRDYGFFAELASQRTTKHGLNLGALILIFTALLIGINFMGFRHHKKFDVTKGTLNSLSEQTVGILKSLDSEMMVRGFFTDNQDGGAAVSRFKQLVEMYASSSSKIKFLVINPVKKPEEAKAFDVNTSGTIILEYKGKKTRFDDASEQAFTNAIIKVTRGKNKNIYYITGHAEKDFESTEPGGASNFKKYLSDSSYDLKPLSFLEKTEVPADAEVVIIAGPKLAYLEPEIKALKKYLYHGGKVFLALDPNSKTNLGSLSKYMGVEFKQNYILDQLGQLVGGGGATAVGISYSPTNDITKGFNQSMTIFQLASQLKVSPDKTDAIRLDEVVKSGPSSFTKKELSQGQIKYEPGKDEKGPLSIMMTASGKLKNDSGYKDAGAEFNGVIVGDSDFITNQLIDAQLNHDLALNSLAFLAKDKELVNIRPKSAESASITMTEIQKYLIFWILVILLPLSVLGAGTYTWLRRRMA